jgi:hypothetical protein
MTWKTKYIIADIHPCITPILFSSVVGHDDIARQMNLRPDQIVSAGFCFVSYDTGLYICEGESIGLKKKSRPQDTEFINKYLGRAPTY